uniref:Transcription initiation factor TFIID subunit 9 n=1 Tax=Eutreptiella gymnastica TaxID=73025 RepID=A0A7S1I293_9EUGL|mmetsp:Transcript_123359/g.213877  ORF Transcript_123359/g.213877 Transcript_123359/m.213877 type:complete len:174 (+) Transcript_123359:91-612(+)
MSGPTEGALIDETLQSMGITSYDPRVVQQLMEFKHRWCTDILTESVVFAEHAGRTELTVDDVKLATQAKVDYSFTPPRPLESLLKLAAAVNRVTLPEVPDVVQAADRGSCVVLPSQAAFSKSNYQCLKRPTPDTGLSPREPAHCSARTISTPTALATAPVEQKQAPKPGNVFD